MIVILSFIGLSCMLTAIFMLHYKINYHKLFSQIGLLIAIVVIILSIIERG